MIAIRVGIAARWTRSIKHPAPLPTILFGAALLAAFVMCWERPAGAAVLWERDHGSWRVYMESDRLGARGSKTCRLQTSCAAKGAAPSTVAFSLGGGTAVLVLSWLNPMVPPDWQPQPWTLLFFEGRFDITPGALVGDGDARPLFAAAAAERDDIGVFLRALSRTDSLTFRIPGRPDIRVAVAGANPAGRAFFDCLRRRRFT